MSGLDRVIKTLCCSRQGRMERRGAQSSKIAQNPPPGSHAPAQITCYLLGAPQLPSSSGDHNQPLVTPSRKLLRPQHRGLRYHRGGNMKYWLDNMITPLTVIYGCYRFHYMPRFVMQSMYLLSDVSSLVSLSDLCLLENQSK